MNSSNINDDDFCIIFMGTPDFAVSSLEIILKNNIKIAAVVTSPDKPAGRGLKLKTSPVKNYAIQHNIPILQPHNLLDPLFISQLKEYKPSLSVVVAFRILPNEIFNIPKLGTINLHASLLPQYRGAAPINRAIMNGEKITGVTTFIIDKAIDTGKILMQEKIKIEDEETAGELHDRMKIIGANLLFKTIIAMKNNSITPIPQEYYITNNTILKKAPKITKADCIINWETGCINIFNQIRGLSPSPTAFTNLKINKEDKNIQIKIYKANYIFGDKRNEPGKIYTDGKTYLGIGAKDGIVFLKIIKPEGKNIMPIE
ncbi:MAG TPA: methionyl-tRNA formyltransferase, partial [Bacteroidales bacterium]|nr:methionyl-tRNA formyltransferase [Bacteroidales bacterium]